MKALITITILLTLALFINAEMTDYLAYQKKELKQWESDVLAIKPIYKGKFNGKPIYIGNLGKEYYYPNGISRLLKYKQYVFAQENYYRELK